jgi:hypothetical protein
VAKKLTAGQKRAARRPGVGGKKAGLWKNVWQKRARQVRKADRKKKK